AQLSADSTLPAKARDDAMTLPKGTDVYLKITDQNGKPYLGQTATQSAWLRVDYLVVNGQKVELKTVGETINGGGGFTLQQGRGRAGQPPRVMEPAGARKIFTVAEQADVSLDATAAAPVAPSPVAKPDAPAAPRPGVGKAPAAAAPVPVP